MMENKLKPLLSGLILIMAFLFAPLTSGTGLTTHQNHGRTYYYHGKQLPHHYNSSQYNGRDRGYGYRTPRRDYGYHYDEGYSPDQQRAPDYRSYGGDKSYFGSHKPPYDYHGRAYYPHNPRATHENTVHDGHGYHQGYDSGYHDGYRDAPKPYSGGAIYLYKGNQ